LIYVTHISSFKSSNMAKPAIADPQLVSKTTAEGDLIRNMS